MTRKIVISSRNYTRAKPATTKLERPRQSWLPDFVYKPYTLLTGVCRHFDLELCIEIQCKNTTY